MFSEAFINGRSDIILSFFSPGKYRNSPLKYASTASSVNLTHSPFMLET
jgi:hypothetical protein